MASFSQHRPVQREVAGRCSGRGGWRMGAGSPRRPSQSPHAKRDNKRGSRLPCLAGSNCSVTLLKYSLSVDWWVMVGGRRKEVGGRSLGVAHFRPQVTRLPACLVSYHLPARSPPSLASAKFNLYCATNADREPSPAGSSVASAPKVATGGDRETDGLGSRWCTLILMWPANIGHTERERSETDMETGVGFSCQLACSLIDEAPLPALLAGLPLATNRYPATHCKHFISFLSVAANLLCLLKIECRQWWTAECGWH